MTETSTTEAAAPETVTDSVTDVGTLDQSGEAQQTPQVEESSDAKSGQDGPLLTKREARKALHEERRAKAEQERAAKKAAESRKRDRDADSGKFLPDDGEKEEEQESSAGDTAGDEQDTNPEAASEQAPDEQDESGDDSAAEDKAGPDKIRVEINPDHPISEMGLDAFEASTPLEAQAMQALLNGTYNRRRDVETLEERVETLQQRLRESETKVVDLESTQSAADRWKKSPEGQAAAERFEQIKEEFGQEAASDYWKGVQEKYRKLVEEERTTRATEITDRDRQDSGEMWKREALSRIEDRLPEHIREIPDFPRWVDEEIAFLNDRLEAGLLPEVTDSETAHAELARLLVNRLSREPAVKEVYTARQAAEKRAEEQKTERAEESRKRAEADKAAAVDEYKRKQAEGRKNIPPNPIASVPGTVGGRSDSEEGAGADETSGLTPAQLKRHAKKAARADARRRFGT